MERQASRPGGRPREAAFVFLTTVAVLTLIISSLSIIPSNEGGNGHEITSGQYIDYWISGTLNSIAVTGEVRYYFEETGEQGSGSLVVTLSARAPLNGSAPFLNDPLLVSKNYDPDGINLTIIGDLLIYRLPQYAGPDGPELSLGTFGTPVDRQAVQTSLYSGECVHYINENNGTALEQWVPFGTGLPIKLRYTDGRGTDLTLSGWDSNIDWVANLD